jgi:phosphoribosylformimino-5-aminoimidazole carboxamide ribotide isomerase
LKVIAAIDIMSGCVVRLVRGNPANKAVYSDDPVKIAMKWQAAGADMLHIVDLDATLQTGKINADTISKIIHTVSIPVEVAGGIRSLDIVNEMFNKNAARVVIGTMAYQELDSLKKIIKKYGGNKIVISIDQSNGMVMINGWRESSGSSMTEAIHLFTTIGAREFLLTSIDRDGTLDGPDVKTLSHVASSFAKTKIIASGGISSLEDIIRVRIAGCSSVILGKALYEHKLSIGKVKAIL